MQDSTKQFVSFSGVETEIRNFEPVSSFWQHETAHLLGFSAPLKNIWEGVQPSKLPNRRPRLLLDVGQDGNCLGNNEQNMFDSPKSCALGKRSHKILDMYGSQSTEVL